MSESTTAAPVSSAPGTTETPTSEAQSNENDSREESHSPKEETNKPQPKMRKVKVNGREEVVDEDTVFRDYQKYQAANELFQQANMSKKQVTEFVKALQENPEEVLRNPQLGINRRELAEKWLREEIEAELIDPKDRRLAELEAENSGYKSKEEEKRQTREAEEHQARVAEHRQQISTDLEKAMEATVLKKDESTLREMAAVMRMAIEQGIDVSPEEIARHVETRKLNNFIQVAQRLDGEQLLEFLGQEVTNKIRKADLAKLRGPAKDDLSPLAPKPSTSTREKAPRTMDRWEMIQMANKKLGL